MDRNFNLILKNEDLFTIGEILRDWKQDWGTSPPSRSTIERWRTAGFRGIKLETEIILNRRRTSKEAINRFLKAMNQDPNQNNTVSTQSILIKEIDLKPKRLSRNEMKELKEKFRFNS